ncbi:MAG TPA: tRNA lysidine(34) synthetase TilS [Candidatus Omnitrophota bacterium]|nr:tRNA lysidine(34) synthetase TilS [Candidatus Omnitrophota bacterium]
MITKVKKNIQSAEFFGYRGTVIVGVSGGSDSMALTHLLHALQYELGFHLHIAHFNHNLRRSAKADQKFVEEVAEELNVPCSVGYWKNAKALKKGSLEEAARTERFKFFRRLAKKINSKVVVLAHTEDDLAETVLMRILRGTGLQGLRGILPRRELEDIWVIRPLLNIKKSAILTYLKKKKIPFRADPTNRQKKFFRNKVRLELLPLLARRYNHNIKEILINLAKNAGTDYDYLENQAQKIFKKHAQCPSNRKTVSIDLNVFSAQHSAIKNMIVRLSIQWMKGDTNRLTSAHFREIESLLNDRPKGAIVHLPQGICLKKNIQYLVLFRTQPFIRDSSKIFV